MHGKDGKKPNSRHNDSRPKLLWKSAFEFRSPYTVDECVTRLKAFQEKQSEVKVHEIVDNGGVVNLSLSLSMPRNTAWLEGTIEYRENEPTLVRGFTGIDRFTVLMFYLTPPIATALVGLFGSPLVLLDIGFAIFFYVLFVGGGLLFAGSLKFDLKETLQNVCGKAEDI